MVSVFVCTRRLQSVEMNYTPHRVFEDERLPVTLFEKRKMNRRFVFRFCCCTLVHVVPSRYLLLHCITTVGCWWYEKIMCSNISAASSTHCNSTLFMPRQESTFSTMIGSNVCFPPHRASSQLSGLAMWISLHRTSIWIIKHTTPT